MQPAVVKVCSIDCPDFPDSALSALLAYTDSQYFGNKWVTLSKSMASWASYTVKGSASLCIFAA